MQDALDRLRLDYPWPTEKPDVPPAVWEVDGLPHGWCCGENIEMFKRLTPPGGVFVELGSWLGRSAMHVMQQTQCGTLICIDHWKGSAEHHGNPDWAQFLPTLYESFFVNLWDHRGRIIPMRTDSIAGMEELARRGIRPDVLYIDESHDADSVERGLRVAMHLFPDAAICGDDWTHETVREGIARVLPLESVHSDNVCWWL